MSIKLNCFIIFILFFCRSYSQKYETIKLNKVPLKTHFDPMDYNAGIQNWSFDQDSNGILYIANNDGNNMAFNAPVVEMLTHCA